MKKKFRKEIIAIFVTKLFRSFLDFFGKTVTRSILLLLQFSPPSSSIYLSFKELCHFFFFPFPFPILAITLHDSFENLNSSFDFAFFLSLDRRLYRIGKIFGEFTRFLMFFFLLLLRKELIWISICIHMNSILPRIFAFHAKYWARNYALHICVYCSFFFRVCVCVCVFISRSLSGMYK